MRKKTDVFIQKTEQFVCLYGTVGTVPVRVSPEIADLLFVLDLSSSSSKSVADLVRDARSQLPPDGESIVFLGHLNGPSAVSKAKELVGTTATLAAIALVGSSSVELVTAERCPHVASLGL